MSFLFQVGRRNFRQRVFREAVETSFFCDQPEMIIVGVPAACFVEVVDKGPLNILKTGNSEGKGFFFFFYFKSLQVLQVQSTFLFGERIPRYYFIILRLVLGRKGYFDP